MSKVKILPEVKSEVGQLEVVLLHRPGRELENMTPENVERALYSDILNLSVAAREYQQFEQVLRGSSQVLEVSDLLGTVLDNQNVKESLVARICRNENHSDIIEELALLEGPEVARLLVEGVELKKDNLSRYFSKETYSLVPLHNFFYTRDASVVINQRVLIARMASKVRERESIIMECIFDNHPMFDAQTVNPASYLDLGLDSTLSIEGGDVLVAREDVLLVGLGARSTTRGVDFILERFKQRNETRTIIVQELPRTPESFIHLDMVFTFLDTNTCMVYEPLILHPNRYQTVSIQVNQGKVAAIRQENNIPDALKRLGLEMEVVYCGGRVDPVVQQREQWHSGANFFALAPGQVIGYERNVYTIEELSQSGFEVIKAKDILSGKSRISPGKRCVVTIEGSELSRGGGGARCMTMPFRRKPL